jgi:alpha-N-arabinofuranosidase
VKAESRSVNTLNSGTVASQKAKKWVTFRHMGRCIYGGIYDPTNEHNLIDENGFRTDVIDCMKELQVPVVRYPGGNFVATYRWQDGVGPREKRPKRPELAWLGTESNQFGTDEFMLWCEKVGAEPYLALNMGTGSLEDGEIAVKFYQKNAANLG